MPTPPPRNGVTVLHSSGGNAIHRVPPPPLGRAWSTQDLHQPIQSTTCIYVYTYTIICLLAMAMGSHYARNDRKPISICFILHREGLYLSGVTISICFGSLMTAWILGQRMLMGNMERSLSTSPCMIRAQNGVIQKTLPSRMCSSTRLEIDALLPSEHTIPGHGTNCFSFDAKLSTFVLWIQ